MQKKKLSNELTVVAFEESNEYDAADPALRDIHQRNHQTKLKLAQRMLLLGLKPESVELLLNISVPTSDESQLPEVEEKEDE